MKKLILIILLIGFTKVEAQNLIKNPSFENYWGGTCSNHPIGLYDTFNVTTPFGCTIKDWIRISESPDGYWYSAGSFPTNENDYYLYPHSDSVCVGLGFVYKALPNLREIIQGKLTKLLIKNHHYQFSMYVQLFDSISWADVGKIVGCNNFNALFTDTAITSVTDLPIQNYHPQIQIDSMVIDTQHWVLLVDTFIAAGGEQFVSIGNFKTDAQTQTQLVKAVNNKPEVAYYFIDDVSLIDLDNVGIEEIESKKLEVYPNPTTNELRINSANIQLTTIEITDLLGSPCIIPPLQRLQIPKESGGLGGFELNISNLANGLYFIKATTTNGNLHYAKFIKY